MKNITIMSVMWNNIKTPHFLSWGFEEGINQIVIEH